jgi:hypothetical protein
VSQCLAPCSFIYSDLGLDFEIYLMSSPYNFKTLYLLNRSSDLDNSYAHMFVAMSRSI